MTHGTPASNIGPVVGGERQRPESRKVLGAGALASLCETACKRNAEERRAELTRPERTVRKVENRCKVHVHAGPTQCGPRRSPRQKRLALAAHGTCRPPRRQPRERPDVPALLIREDQRPGRTRRGPVPAPHDHTGHSGRSRKARDDDERRLLLRRQTEDYGRRDERG